MTTLKGYGIFTDMEAIHRLIDEIKDEFENIGMYLSDVNIMADRELEGDDGEGVEPDIRQMMLDGEAQFAIVVEFGLNELAFSDQVLNPEGHKENIEFKAAMPTEAEMTIEALKDQLRKKDD